MVLSPTHRALIDAETIFPKTRIHPEDAGCLLKSGEHNKKIGSCVMSGKWAGMPIFTLTLEERATCSRACEHWADCYGNQMHWSKRIIHGPALEAKLQTELTALQEESPAGFLVRLHILGDFYSPEYVARWARWLIQFPALHVYGYTRWRRWDDIGSLIAILNMRPDRWVVRFSNAGGVDGTITVDSEGEGISNGAFVCPAQTGKSKANCCANCAVCWTRTTKPIAFLRH